MSFHDGDSTDSNAAPPYPTTINSRYSVYLDKHLGSGHFGCVFEGRDEVANRPVAVKLSKTRISSREVAALKALRGKGAPKLLFHGIEDRYHVLVMQKLGNSLYKYVYFHLYIR